MRALRFNLPTYREKMLAVEAVDLTLPWEKPDGKNVKLSVYILTTQRGAGD